MIHASLIKVLYSIKQTHFYAIHCLSHQEKKVAIKLRISIRKVLVFSSEPHQSREFSGGRFHLPQAESDFSEALRRFTGSRQNGWPVESPSNTASDVPPLEMLCSRLHIWLEVTIPKLIHAHRLERIRAAQGVGNELCPTHPQQSVLVVLVGYGGVQIFYLFSEATLHWIPIGINPFLSI